MSENNFNEKLDLYNNHKEQAKLVKDTATFDLMQNYINSIRSSNLHDGRNVNLSLLEEEEVKNKFDSNLLNGISKVSYKVLGVNPVEGKQNSYSTGDFHSKLSENIVTKGVFGASLNDIKNSLESRTLNSGDDLLKEISNYSGAVNQTVDSYAGKGIFEKKDISDILDYTGTKDILDASRVTPDIGEHLIQAYDNFGILNKKILGPSFKPLFKPEQETLEEKLNQKSPKGGPTGGSGSSEIVPYSDLINKSYNQ